MSKSQIYIDAEDDITAVIEAVKKAEHKIVALVLPKRVEVLRSVVNMKLLKRAASTAKKQVVLITNDKNVVAIAAATKMYVANTLRSKPNIPSVPKQTEKPKDDDKSDVAAAATGVKTAKKVASKSKKPKKTSKKLTGKKIKVPNFDLFRLRLVLVALAVLALPVLWFVGFKVLPSARVVINTNARSLPVSLEVSLAADESIEAAPGGETLLPTVLEENKQQLRGDIVATGEKEIGENATGLMTISNCTDDEVTLANGTGFSAGNLNFSSQVAVTLESGNFTGGGVCKSTGGHVKTVTVAANEPGDQYNLSSRAYTIAGVSGDITAFGGEMSGGISETVKVITQQDIDDARTRVDANREDAPIQEQLSTALIDQGLTPITDTFFMQTTSETADVEVDQEVDSGTLTVSVTYSMHGYKESDLLGLLLPLYEEQAGGLEVIDSGASTIKFRTQRFGDSGVTATITATGSAGLILDAEDIFDQIKGRPADEAAAELRNRDGVTQVEASASPFWTTSIPDNRDKVEILINGN